MLTGVYENFALIIIVGFTVFLCYTKWWVHTYWKRSAIPQIDPIFVLGAAYDILKNRENMSVTFARLHNKIKAKGLKYAGVYFFLRPVFMPVDLDLIKDILIKDFDYFEDRDFYTNEGDDPLSNNLLTQEGEVWKAMRKKLNPTFTPVQLKWMFNVFIECNKNVPGVLDKYISGNPIRIKKVFERITTDAIASCAFGIDSNSLLNPKSEFLKYGKRAADLGPREILFVLFFNIFPYKMLRWFGFRIIRKEVEDFFMKIVRENVRLREEKVVYRKDFVQLLVEVKEKGGLSVENIAAQAFVFFIGAFDTTANILLFAMLELARNQNIQDRLRRDINDVLGKYNGKITYDAVNEMEYLNCVLDETLRKYCPAPFVTRKCTKDYKIPNTENTIRKGTTILLSNYAIHQDPEYYPNPDVFDPERFSTEKRAQIPQLAFMPFGAGPRICIGFRFGMMQSKVVICSMLKNYRFTCNERTKYPVSFYPYSLVFTSNEEILLNVQKITNTF